MSPLLDVFEGSAPRAPGRLAKLSAASDRTEASLLREALDDLLDKHKDAL